MYYSTAKEMEKLDEIAVDAGLEIRQMMELAGWHIVILFDRLNISLDSKIVIPCGKGNKGGDGLSAARHLVNHGYSNVNVMLATTEDELKPDPKHHLNLLKKMKIHVISFDKRMLHNADIIIDSLLGYHLDGAPHGIYADIIWGINDSHAKVISYDVPSGVDATTGECFDPCVKSDVTLTLAMPKKIFDTEEGKNMSGDVYVADIGIPKFLYDKIEKGSRPNFSESGITTL